MGQSRLSRKGMCFSAAASIVLVVLGKLPHVLGSQFLFSVKWDQYHSSASDNED